jgi:hypothetical protein
MKNKKEIRFEKVVINSENVYWKMFGTESMIISFLETFPDGIRIICPACNGSGKRGSFSKKRYSTR